ncbi:hypothetical protein MT347_05495 [Microbacterium sp. VKM Ac-2923]|nr:hypothetical protein [Microbacterium sp. VKM Ac-2923]
MPTDLTDVSRITAVADDLILPALHTRSLARRSIQSTSAHFMPTRVWQASYAVAAADHVLEQLSTPWRIFEVGDRENELWAWQLREGLDSYARIAWCMRFGHSTAAVALTRQFLERWTYNVAFSWDLSQDAGEDDQDFIDRVWSQYEARLEGRSTGEDWAALSELLHGRVANIQGEQISLQLTLAQNHREVLHAYLAEVCEAPLLQIRASTSLVAQAEEIDPCIAPAILLAANTVFPIVPPPPDLDPEAFLSIFHEPLSHDFVSSAGAKTLLSWGETYRTLVRRGLGKKFRLAPHQSWMPIEERWVRAVEQAQLAFDDEAQLLRDDFAPEVLETRLIWFQAVTEMADLLADQLEHDGHSASLRTAAAAMESAWILWLQDVDESLTCVRAVLECVARARTFRMKPTRAVKLFARGRATTPHRWLDAAGLGRLAPFGRSLGEFAHMMERSRHAGSRALLTLIQLDAPQETAELTARANALSRVAMMLAHEVSATLDLQDSSLGDVFRAHILTETEAETEAELLRWLERAATFRGHDFGPADYAAPAK